MRIEHIGKVQELMNRVNELEHVNAGLKLDLLASKQQIYSLFIVIAILVLLILFT